MRIDAHMHFTPAGYRAELTEHSLLPFPLPAWSAERALAFMDGHDIDKAVLSLSPPGVAFGDQALGEHLARLVNEGDCVRGGGAARTLRWSGGPAAAGRRPGAGDRARCSAAPGDPEWIPLWDELEARGAYVLLHSTAPAYELPVAGHPAWVYRFPFETTRAVASLISAGAGVRWPSIRLQVAHLGGTIPFLAGRLASLVELATPRAFLRGLFYDTALDSGPLALAAAREHAGPDQVVLGSGWPYVDALDPGVARYARNGTALLPPERRARTRLAAAA